ncbi:MAG: hypothetical protein LBK67_09340 [Coriobacteriales bacterium]|nr:hypothetical protein [Coriobacteriales bacterium]
MKRALAAGAAATAVGGGVALGGCAPSKEQQFVELVSQGVEDEDIVTLAVAPEQVVEVTDFAEAAFEDYLELQAIYELPLGSLVHQIDSSAALVLLPGGEGKSLKGIGLLNLESGEVTSIIDGPVTLGKNMVIYDARASRTGLIWVEFDLGDHRWRVRVALLNGTEVGDSLLVEEGDADFEPPMLAVADNKFYWTVMPVATGAASQEDSHLRALEFRQGESLGQRRPYTVLASHGRMITNPLVTDGVVTFVPRVDTANVYYQLTALNCSDDRVLDFRVLPQSLRVADALYRGETFSFSIEGNYEYADGLAHFGTYQERDDGSYLHVNRSPLSPVVYFKDCLIIKSPTNVVGVDPVGSKTFVIDAPPQSPKFGEALVGWGVQDKVVTSSIRLAEHEGNMEVTVVRVFA